jgi:sterol desaturase/sphingolipid hydroxylase (fatty acid hydroxylase superfamily)
VTGPIPRWAVSAIVIAGGFALLTTLEVLSPLRRTVEGKMRRLARNLSVGAVSLAVVTVLETLLLVPAARWAYVHHLGILNTLALPGMASLLLAVILLDYSLWWWHWASHSIDFLWRFHIAHHIDRDLDASTALRFHFGELSLSMIYRLGQIAIIGPSSQAIWVWQTILFGAILFHHSNLCLPIAVERVLVRLVVTPRMHGIHHSDRRNEANSNWSSILSVWDFLHRTIVLNVPQSQITIGVPAYSQARDVTVGKTLAVPFTAIPDAWILPDGTQAVRQHDQASRAELAP